MVYNFALPPLVLHTFYPENATALSRWAESLDSGSAQAAFFNILDTHDGIGLMGVKEILRREDIELILERARQHGGLISYKSSEQGQNEPYGINITW